MSPLRRTLDIAGRVLVGAGIVLLLFTVYQIWGTSLQEAHTQAGAAHHPGAGDAQRGAAQHHRRRATRSTACRRGLR